MDCGSVVWHQRQRFCRAGTHTCWIFADVDLFNAKKKGGNMITFDQAFNRLIGIEAGYTNDPRDKGNWTGGQVGVGICKGTKYGIAASSYPKLDIKNLTLDQAKAIYKSDWWDAIGADKLPTAIIYQVWDFAINSGMTTAKKQLQQAIGVTADGVIGSVTIAKINSMDLSDVLMLYIAERITFDTALSTWATYGKGWMNRMAKNLCYAAVDN